MKHIKLWKPHQGIVYFIWTLQMNKRPRHWLNLLSISISWSRCQELKTHTNTLFPNIDLFSKKSLLKFFWSQMSTLAIFPDLPKFHLPSQNLPWACKLWDKRGQNCKVLDHWLADCLRCSGTLKGVAMTLLTPISDPHSWWRCENAQMASWVGSTFIKKKAHIDVLISVHLEISPSLTIKQDGWGYSANPSSDFSPLLSIWSCHHDLIFAACVHTCSFHQGSLHYQGK